MKRSFLYILLLSLSVCASAQTQLATSIDSLIATLPQESEVGIAVYDLTSNEMLYTFRDKKLSRPASTMKLLTTITALTYLDTKESFKTEVWYDGTLQGDTLNGDLYVVGGFDPEFGDEGMNNLVDSIVALPIRVINGKVYGDVSMVDSLYWGSGWAWDDNPEAFQPFMSPLMYNKGKIEVVATPSQNRGGEVLVEVKPQSTYYTVSNKAITRTPSAGKFRITRDWMNNDNEILISGNLEKRQAKELNLYSSQNFFMHTFIERLQAMGVQGLDRYDFVSLEQSDQSVLISSYETSFQAVINEILKESDNLNAEALLYRIASKTKGKKNVSSQDGLEQLNRMIRKIGHNPLDYKIADGSGLSNYNYLSPALLLDLLIYAYNDSPIFQRLYKALPTSGMEGTVKHRMKPGPAFKNVHAKTGSFTAINSLAGYAKSANGHMLAFVIMNQNVLSGRKARMFQDQVCEVLCGLTD